MEIQVTKEKDTVVVTVKGRIDAVTAPEFEKQLADQMAAGEKMFLLNFSGLEYISSAGLRSILVTAKQLKAKEGKLFFAELQRTVKDVFKISGFGSLFASRMAVGIGEAALSPGALSMIADSFPRQKRGAPIAVYSTALTIGAGLASLLGASILAYAKQAHELYFLGMGPLSPWRFTFLVVSLPGFVLAPLFFLLREPPRGMNDVEGEKPVRGLGDGLHWVKGRFTTYVGLVSLVCVMTIIAYGQGGWNASLFERNWGWAPERFATVNGLINLLIGPFAVLAAGRWADAWSKQLADAPLRILLIGALIMIACASAYPLMPTATLGFAFLALANIGIAIMSAVGVLAVLEITPATVRGQVVALYYMAISLSGLFLGPPVVGWLSDHVFGPPQLRWAMATLPALFGAVPLLLAARTRALYLEALARQK